MSEIKFGVLPISSDIARLTVDKLEGNIKNTITELGAEWLEEGQILFEKPFCFFILTGGTENKFLKLWEKRKVLAPSEPVIILAHAAHNSLAASIEILARLHQDNVKGKIIFVDNSTNKKWDDELRKFIKNIDLFYQLKKTRIGLIGDPSDWLVASSPDSSIIKSVWGPEVIKIEIDELKKNIGSITELEIENDNYFLTTNAKSIKEPSKKEIKEVVKIHSAIKKITADYNLNSVSVRCFDLVTDLKTTGCYALSKLNDEGINAGCEGDLVSTLGIIWANYFTDEVAWMANPVQIDETNNEMWLAHCTVPISLVENYKLRSHFESGLGVGIEGEFSNGKITLLRIGGKNLEKIWVTNGEIIEAGSSEVLCRTQVKIKLHGSAKVTDLLKYPLGNHLIMVRGSYAKEMIEWWETFIH